jgi:FMN phosphatase YigB (HAD superfamily)
VAQDNLISWPLSSSQIAKIKESDLVTFDLFDTLVIRKQGQDFQYKNYNYFQRKIRIIFEYVCRALTKLGILPDFKLSWLNSFLDTESEFKSDFEQVVPINVMVDFVKEIRKFTSVVVVSNTYYTEAQLAEILINVGLENIKVVASSEYGVSKFNGLKKSAGLYADFHVHVGDNLKEDGGFGSDLFVLFDKYCNIHEFKQYLPKSPVTEVIINSTLENQNLNYWEKFGMVFSGPIALFCAKSLLHVKSKIGFSRIACLARDGYLVNYALNKIESGTSTYIPYSRKISSNPEEVELLAANLSSEIPNENILLFDLGWTGRSASKLVEARPENFKLALLARWPWKMKLENFQLIDFPRHWRHLISFRSCPELWELCLSAPHPTYASLNSFEYRNALEASINECIASGAEIFLNKVDGCHEEDDELLVGLGMLIKRPTGYHLLKLAEVNHEFNDQRVPLVGPNTHKVIYWIKGYKQMSRMTGEKSTTIAKSVMAEWLRRLKSAL